MAICFGQIRCKFPELEHCTENLLIASQPLILKLDTANFYLFKSFKLSIMVSKTAAFCLFSIRLMLSHIFLVIICGGFMYAIV